MIWKVILVLVFSHLITFVYGDFSTNRNVSISSQVQCAIQWQSVINYRIVITVRRARTPSTFFVGREKVNSITSSHKIWTSAVKWQAARATVVCRTTRDLRAIGVITNMITQCNYVITRKYAQLGTSPLSCSIRTSTDSRLESKKPQTFPLTITRR